MKPLLLLCTFFGVKRRKRSRGRKGSNIHNIYGPTFLRQQEMEISLPTLSSFFVARIDCEKLTDAYQVS